MKEMILVVVAKDEREGRGRWRPNCSNRLITEKATVTCCDSRSSAKCRSLDGACKEPKSGNRIATWSTG